MDNYEILLIAWSVLLTVWTVLIILAAFDYLRAIKRLDLERQLWLERVERTRREARYPLP